MAALVSESWIAGDELGLGRAFGNTRRRQPNGQARLARAAHVPPRPVDEWLAGTNNVATAGTGVNNSTPTNTNNGRNARNRNNASQANPQQNSIWSNQPQAQGRNRNRNRNKNRNRNGQQAGNEEQAGNPSGPPNGPPRGRRGGQNNQGGRRPNQSNADAANNLTTDPNTGEVISKRAAKRRRAKARKAAADREASATSAPPPPPPPVVQPQAPVVQPATSTNRTATCSHTQSSNARTSITCACGQHTIPLSSLSSRNSLHSSTQPERTGISTTRPIFTPGASSSNAVAQPASRVSANLDSIDRDNTLDRWRYFLNQDVPQAARPTNPATGSNSNPPARPTASSSHVRTTPAAPPAPLANRILTTSGLQTGRIGTVAAPSTSRAAPAASNRPAPPRLFSWESDDSDGFADMPPLTRNVRPPAAPIRSSVYSVAPPIVPRVVPRVVPPVVPARPPPTAGPSRVPLTSNATRRVPASTSTRPTPVRTRPTTACLICLDIPDEFPRQRPSSRCTHSITICAPCLEQHVSHQVVSQGSTTLTCPDPSCRQSLEYADVIRATKGAKTSQDRYETLLLRRALETVPNFVRCKNASCDGGQVHESGANAPIVICQVCRARSCFTHNVPWHTGLTCAQYSARNADKERENQASEDYITRNAKQCPNTKCGRRIEKNDGCDHMTCRRPAGCGHEFCWVCLADYGPIREDGNHHHNSTCRYYTSIAPRTTAFNDYLRQHQQRYGVPVPPRPEPYIPPRPRVEPIIPLRPTPQPRVPEAPAAQAGLFDWIAGWFR